MAVLGIDLRSLSLFRVGLALILLGDLASRAVDLTAHYADPGVFPRILNLEYNEPTRISLHLMAGTPEMQAGLFLLQAILAIGLLIGWKTSWMSFFSWFFLVSLHNRNPSVLGGGDILLRLLSFWGIFLPLGARFSLDYALNPDADKDPGPPVIFSAATAGILIQVALVYWFSVVWKNHKEWREEGTAIYYALQIDQLTTPLGRKLLEFPTLLKGATKATLVFEALGPLLAFSPWATGPLRTGVAASFIFFHGVALALTMNLGIFPYVCTLSWLLFLPPWFWEKLEKLMGPSEKGRGLTIYYDGDCGFCRKMVGLLKTFLWVPEAQVKRAQENSSVHNQMLEKKSWVVEDQDRHLHFAFDAFTLLAGHSPFRIFLHPFLNRLKNSRWGAKLYYGVAQRRAALGKISALFKEGPHFVRLSPWGQGLSLFFLLYIFLWNIHELDKKGWEEHFPLNVLQKNLWIGHGLGLDQNWSLFAPYPYKDDGWFVMPGSLKNGEQVEVFQGKKQKVVWEKPELVYETFANRRWAKYFRNIWFGQYEKLRGPLAQYLCRNWNRSQANDMDKLEFFEIYYMKEETPLPGHAPSVEKILLWRQYC